MSERGGVLCGLRFCSHCRDIFKVILSPNVGVVIHWVGEHMFFDVVLCFEGCGASYVLYREVYARSR